MASAGKFLYFGFGSNLLRQRIHVNNPSAVRKTIAKLQDFKLAFNDFCGGWQGASATMIKSPGDHVWGVVWELNNEDLPNLDRQEGVDLNEYRAIDVEVETKDGDGLRCRSYELVKAWEPGHKPSPQYKYVIVAGAKQNNLPEEYIKILEAIEDNGYTGNDTRLNTIKFD